MSLSQHAARGLKWQAIELLLRQLISLGIFATLSRLLAPEDFGLFALVNLYLGFVAILGAQGLRTAIIQRRSLESEHLDSTFWYSAVVAGIVFLLTWILAPWIAAVLGDGRLAVYLRVASIIPVINALSNLHNSLFTRALDFRRPAIRTIVANLAGGIAGVLLALNDYGPWALIWQQIIAAFAGGIFLWRASAYRPQFRFSWRHLNDLRAVGGAMFTTSFLWFFASRIDHYLLGRFSGPATLGIYTLAGRLPELAKLITQQPLSQVSTPALSRLQDDPNELKRSVYGAMELVAFLTCPIFVGLAAVSNDAIPLIFGVQWAAAAPACALLAISALVSTLMVFVHPTLLARGANRDYVVLNAGQAICASAFCFLGVKHGAAGVALAMLATNIVSAAPALALLKKWAGISPGRYLLPCLRPMLSSVFMYFALQQVSSSFADSWSSIFSLAVKIAIGGSLYLGLSYVLQRSTVIKTIHFLQKAVR